MYQIYVGCDWHLYSNKYDARHPYRTARSIGRLADNYGYMIDETDIFIFLGDLCDLQVCDMKKLNQISNIIHNIKGYKIMCKGNHDLFDDDVYLELGFDEVCDIATAYGLVFSHVPVRVMPNEINIHAHLHHEKVSSLGYQHINAYSANFQKEDQPILVDTLLKEAPIQDIDYNEKWSKEVTEQFKQYTAIHDNMLHSKIIDISDKIPLYPVDEASAEMNEVLFPDTDSTKYWEADDNTYQDELDAAEYSDARKPHKVRDKNDVVAESSSRLRVYTKPLYRITYDGIGIYEAYKKACSFDEWRSFINSDAATWLDVPKIYNRDINHTSYFTKRGYELFQKNTYPVIIQKLNKRNIKVDQVILDVKPVYEDLYQVVVPNPVDESVYDQNKGYRAIAYDKNLHPIELKSTLHENISFTNSFPITALDELLQEIINYDNINDPLHEGTLLYDVFDNSNGNKYTLTSKDCIELLSSTNIFTESSSGIVVDLAPLVGKNMGKKTILSKDIFDNFLRIAPEALDKEKIMTARDAQDLIDMFNKMCMKAINDTYKHDKHFSDLDSYTAGFHILAMIYAYNGCTITKKALKKVSPNLFPLDLEGPEFESYIRDVIDQLTKVEAFYINMVEYALTFIGFGYADSVNTLKNLDGPNAIKMAKKYVDKNKAEFTKTYADGTIQYDFRHIHLNHVYIAPNLATDTGYANRIKPSRYIERAKRFDYCIFAHADSYIENGKQMWTIPGGITIDGKQFVNMEDIVKYLNPRKHRILIMSCNPGHIEPNGEVFNNNVEYAGNDVILESSDIHQLNVHTLLKKWLDYTKHGIKRLNKIEEQILTIIDELKLIVAPDAIQLMYGFKLDREEDITPKELRHRFADSIETSISTYMEFLLSSRIIARALMDKLNGTLITECTKGYGWAYSYNGSISTLPESTHTQLYPAIYRYPDKDTMFEDMALAELIPEVSTTINPLIKNEQISDCRFDYVDYAEQSSSDDKYYPTYHNIPESDWPNETALFIQTPRRDISKVESSLTESSAVRTQILGENLTLDSYRSDDIALQINGTKYKIKAKDILDDYINISPEDIADCREEEIRSIDDLSDRLYKVLQSYGKHYEESCAGAKSLYNLMMIATDSNDPFSKPENKKLFRMMVEYFLPKGITDKQFNDLVHTRMRELKDIEYYLIKLLETNIALFGLEVTEVNALAMSSDRKKVIKDIKCRVDEQADKITDHRSSCTVYDFNQLYAGINCRVYIGNQLIHDAEQRGISTTPSRFLIRARKYDHIIATHAIANAKYDYEIQPIVMDNGTKVTTVNALLKELSLQNAKNVLLLICNPNAIDLDPIIDRYRMNVDYINPDSDGEDIIAIYESSANTALKYMSIMDELDSWNTRLKTTRKSIDHMECDLYDYMERYGYLTAPEKIYFAKLNANTSHPIQVKDKTSIKYENYIKLRGYGVHLAFTYLKTLLYVTKLFIKYALHRYDRLVTEHASGYQAIMRNQLQMFDQEDQIATFSMQNKSYITESCIGPEDYLYQSMTELREDIELYHWANTDNMMIQESSVKEYNRTDDNKPIRDRKESKEYAEKYGIRPIGQEEPDEKSSEEIGRMKKAKQLQHARAIKKRKKIVNKVKQHLPFVKNEDATAVDNSDIMELDIEHSPLYGDKKNFFYNYNMPKEVNDPAERLDESFHADTFLIEPKTFFSGIKLYHISRSKLTKIIPGSINVGNRLQVKPRMSSWWTPYYKRQAAWMLMVELKSKYGVDKATKWNNFSWTTVYDQEMQRNAPQVVIRKKFYEDHKREIDNFKVYVHEKIFKGNELGLGVEYSTKEYTCDEPITPDKVFILQLDDFRDYITIADDAEFKQLTARFAEAKKNHKHLSDILDVDKPWYYYDYETAKQKKLKQDHIISETSHKSIIDSGHKQHGHINLDDLTKIEITEKWRKEHVVQYPWLKHIASSDDEIDASAWLDDDKLVAIISVDRSPSKRDKVWIHNIHVEDKYRGYGLSKQLLDYAINNYKANALAVKIDNKLAQKVYLDYGFSFGSGKDDTMGNSKIMYLNESSIQESYQFELLDKNVHFYDKMDETASYQAKGKLYPVYVMLVHSGTTVSNLIKTISHSEYSHASISFDSSLDHMYSFARKDPKNPFLGGFRYESIGKGFYDKKEIPYALYVVPCTEDQVKRMKKRLDYFVKNNSKFSFDFAGLVKNYIGYADEPEYRWFCSRFVADILNAGSPEEFKYIDEPSLMDPDDFKKTNFARFVIAGDNMMKYDRKLVDKLTKKILIEEKHRKQTGYTLAEDVIDPTIPYEDDILVYQLLTMDESVVDDVLNYLQSFKIKFDQDGNVIIHQREYKELSQHFNKSKRMLRHYRKTGATESIKNELCKLYYMINIVETYYLKPTTDEKYKERQKQMMDLRALMINVFRQNLNEVTAKEPNFNFQSYYNASDYGKDLKIPKTVIAATGKALITMLS